MSGWVIPEVVAPVAVVVGGFVRLPSRVHVRELGPEPRRSPPSCQAFRIASSQVITPVTAAVPVGRDAPEVVGVLGRIQVRELRSETRRGPPSCQAFLVFSRIASSQVITPVTAAVPVGRDAPDVVGVLGRIQVRELRSETRRGPPSCQAFLVFSRIASSQVITPVTAAVPVGRDAPEVVGVLGRIQVRELRSETRRGPPLCQALLVFSRIASSQVITPVA